MSRELRRRAAKAAKGKGSPRKTRGRILPDRLTLGELAPILATFSNVTGTILSGQVTNDEIGGFLSHVHMARLSAQKMGESIAPELDTAIVTMSKVRHYEPVDEDEVLTLDKAAEIATAIMLRTPTGIVKEVADSLEMRTYLNEKSMYEV